MQASDRLKDLPIEEKMVTLHDVSWAQYQETSSSQFFPDLDLNLLLKYIEHPDQYDAIQEFLTEVQTSSSEEK